MTKKEIRTRFAPSPTGYLHIGSARTALFSWLYARHLQGTFILRIEDTDRERSTQEAVEVIMEGMEWLNLDYDEGPYFQTDRFERYKEVCEQLVSSGEAYRCYCSKERLLKMREQQEATRQKPRYDGHCRDLDLHIKNQPYVVRFRNPQTGLVTFEDLVRGKISIDNSELDDLVIMRGDGVPTYNFAVVVDDWDMKITHVIRGDDHINNTPRQINILRALAAELPEYGHIPMILGSDHKRLSKRHGAVSVLEYRENGYLPQALINYLVRLGWSYGDQEIFSLQEMIDYFDFKSVQRSPAAFNSEKLDWLNQHYLKTMDPSTLTHSLASHFDKLEIDYLQGPALEEVIKIQAERCKTLKEMVQRSIYFYASNIELDEKAASKHLIASIQSALKKVSEEFALLTDWEKERLHEIIIRVAEEEGVQLGKLAQPIRVAVTGNTTSPPIDTTLYLIGRERVLQRLQQACEYIESIGK